MAAHKGTYVYPERPKNKTGYSDQWITAYLEDKATARQVRKYISAIEGKTGKERRDIFVSMFINPETEEQKFRRILREMARKKSKKET